MKKTSPFVTHGGLLLGILLSALVGSAGVVTYALVLQPENSPGQYPAVPDDAMAEVLANRSAAATTHPGDRLRMLGLESRGKSDSQPRHDSEMSSANVSNGGEIIPTSLANACLDELFAPGILDAALVGSGTASGVTGGAGLQPHRLGQSRAANSEKAIPGPSGKSGGMHASGPRGSGGGAPAPKPGGLIAAESSGTPNWGANVPGPLTDIILNRTHATDNFGSTEVALAAPRQPHQVVYTGNPQSIVPPLPVPDGGTALLLLGLSLGGLGLAKRWVSNT